MVEIATWPGFNRRFITDLHERADFLTKKPYRAVTEAYELIQNIKNTYNETESGDSRRIQ